MSALVALALTVFERRAELRERRKGERRANRRNPVEGLEVEEEGSPTDRPVTGLLTTAAAIALAVVVLLVAWASPEATQRAGSLAVLMNVTHSDKGAVNVSIVSCAQGAVDKAIADGAALTITAVSSSQAAITSIQTSLSANDKRYPVVASDVRKDLRAQAMATIIEVLHGPVPPDPNDTFDAAAIIGDLLKQQPGPRTLVICGGANEIAPGFDVNKTSLTPARSRALIKDLASRLPDLSSIDVIFGAAGLDGRAISGAREAIGRWWTKYWAPAVHARTIAYGPGLHFPSS